MGYEIWQAYEIGQINFIASKKLGVMFEMFSSVTVDRHDSGDDVQFLKSVQSSFNHTGVLLKCFK